MVQPGRSKDTALLNTALSAGMWIAGGVLAWAGVAKLIRPESAGAALRLAGLPGGPGVSRLLGLGELAVGAGALLVGGAVAVSGLSLFYAGLALFSQFQRGVPGSSCGCFGAVESPLTGVHVVYNVAAALIGAGAAWSASAGLLPSLSATPLLLVTTAVGVVTAAGLLTISLTTYPVLKQLLRRSEEVTA